MTVSQSIARMKKRDNPSVFAIQYFYRRKMKFFKWIGLLVICTTLLATGCGDQRARKPQSQTGKERDPFSARAESEDGTIVAWRGNTKGYELGTEASFDITIQNDSEQRWHGQYCLQLLDCQSHQVVATSEEQMFALESGVGFSDIITVQLPEDLEEGTYDLSLIVHRPNGPMVDMVPIQVGYIE